MTGELCKAVKCLNSRWYLKWLGSQAPIFFVLLFVDAGDVNLYWPRDSLVLRLSAMFRILHFLQCCTRLLFHRKYKQSDESEPKYLFISNVYSFIIRNRLSLTADPSWHWTNSGVHPGHVASSSKGVKHRDKQPVTFPFRMIDHSLSFGLWEEAGVPGENLQTPQDNGAQQGNELCPSQVSNPEPFCCKTTALTTEPPYCLCMFQARCILYVCGRWLGVKTANVVFSICCGAGFTHDMCLGQFFLTSQFIKIWNVVRCLLLKYWLSECHSVIHVLLLNQLKL